MLALGYAKKTPKVLAGESSWRAEGSILSMATGERDRGEREGMEKEREVDPGSLGF